MQSALCCCNPAVVNEYKHASGEKRSAHTSCAQQVRRPHQQLEHGTNTPSTSCATRRSPNPTRALIGSTDAESLPPCPLLVALRASRGLQGTPRPGLRQQTAAAAGKPLHLTVTRRRVADALSGIRRNATGVRGTVAPYLGKRWKLVSVEPPE